jgi:hypothetical protein
VRITISHRLLGNATPERSAFTATAAFFDDSVEPWTVSTPTTADYRIDRIRAGDPGCYDEVLAWTSLTPATSINIPVTSANNAISFDYSRDELRQITVRANAGLATQYQGTLRYRVTNLAGQT